MPDKFLSTEVEQDIQSLVASMCVVADGNIERETDNGAALDVRTNGKRMPNKRSTLNKSSQRACMLAVWCKQPKCVASSECAELG